MNKFIWITDIHLDHILPSELAKDEVTEKFTFFCENINAIKSDNIVITGDISNASRIVPHLELLAKCINKKIYFVLGNHDFYHGRIDNVRNAISKIGNPNLVYLTSQVATQNLTKDIGIVGHDGWYDGNYANWFAHGVVEMNDYMTIGDFRDHYLVSQSSMVPDPRIRIFGVMQKLANECAIHIKENLDRACKMHKNVIFATHVPPFAENSRYNGKISDWRWLPNFSSKLAGDALLEVAKANPETKIIVLCGHSHGKAEFHPTPNMICYTGQSDYGRPWISIKEVIL